MKVSLFGLLIFLFCCAGVYYASQFAVVSNLDGNSDIERRRFLAASRLNTAYEKADGVAARMEQAVRKMSHGNGHRRLSNTTHRLSGVAAALAHPMHPEERPPHTEHTERPAHWLAREHAAASAHAATPTLTDASSLQCNRTRRPYHVVMTAASGLYQEWQSRIAYYHYKKMKRLHPCSDLGGFTRLFNTYQAKPDNLMDEIPTVLVKQLGHGNCAECDRGFIVMNRPWGVLQFVETEHFANRIEEEYIFVIETDHMMMRPFENIATPDKPVGCARKSMTHTSHSTAICLLQHCHSL